MSKMRCAGVAAVLVAMVGGCPADAEATASSSAMARLQAAVGAAVARSPEARAGRAALEMAEAEASLEASAGGAYLQLQAEGVGSSFDKEPNAARYLRVGKPFSWPGQARAGRSLVEQVDRYSGAARVTLRASVSRTVALAFVRLAQQAQVVGVLERIDGRLTDAVEVQREKNRLGEVSGSDLLQLELELVDLRADLAEARARLGEVRAAFVSLAGDEAPAPLHGDLEALAAGLDALDGPVCAAERLTSAPPAREAAERVSLGRRRADLAGRVKWGRPAVEVEWENIPDIDGEEGFDAFGVMLELPLPFGRSGRVEQARAEADLRRAEADAAGALRDLGQNCESALAMVRAGRSQLDTLRQMESRLEDAELSLAGQFRLGVASYLEYIDGINRLEDVRLRAISARGDLLAGRIRLAALLGDPSIFPLPHTAPEAQR